MTIFKTLLLFTWIALCTARWSKPRPYDKKCQVRLPRRVNTPCPHHGFIFDKKSSKCVRTCLKYAPFTTENECDYTCRS
ncbi:hypothetical protein V5799_008022, partial [Amblyomma americanum]